MPRSPQLIETPCLPWVTSTLQCPRATGEVPIPGTATARTTRRLERNFEPSITPLLFDPCEILTNSLSLKCLCNFTTPIHREVPDALLPRILYIRSLARTYTFPWPTAL